MSVEPGKWGVIYNPKAGTRKVQKRWKEIKEYMDSKGVSYDYVQSEGFGSVERLAGILTNNGYRTIVVVGGDGALNDAINGIMSSNAEKRRDSHRYHSQRNRKRLCQILGIESGIQTSSRLDYQ